MAEILFRILISLTLKDPVNMESVVFRDPKNITRGGVCYLCQLYHKRKRKSTTFFKIIKVRGLNYFFMIRYFFKWSLRLFIWHNLVWIKYSHNLAPFQNKGIKRYTWILNTLKPWKLPTIYIMFSNLTEERLFYLNTLKS